MAVATEFYDWPRERDDYTEWTTCSPNLVAITDVLEQRHGGLILGCVSNRAVRAGSTPSTHSWGAARDWGYGTDPHDGPGRDVLLADILPWLIDNSAELHIQAVHDYVGGRIWRANRSGDANGGWRKSTSTSGGMNQPWAQWIHIETTLTGWGDTTPITERLTNPDTEDDAMSKWIQPDDGDPCVLATNGMFATWVNNGAAAADLAKAGVRIDTNVGKVKRPTLRGLTLIGSPPAYPPSYIGPRTTPADFAGHLK